MPQIDVDEATMSLTQLIERARAGEEIVIARAGSPLVKLEPIEHSNERARLGSLAGKIALAPDWDDDETNEEIAKLFHNG